MFVLNEYGRLQTVKIRYRDGGRYQIAHDAFFVLPEMEGMHERVVLRELRFERDCLTVKMGYAWNGPSGPVMNTSSFMRASLVHDALYDLIREGKFTAHGAEYWRLRADRVLFRLGIEDGMWRVRAWWTYLGVRAFGWAALRNIECDHTAP